jgi:hypothetical protein
MLFLDIDVIKPITRSLMFYKDTNLLIEILTVFNMIYIPFYNGWCDCTSEFLSSNK